MAKQSVLDKMPANEKQELMIAARALGFGIFALPEYKIEPQFWRLGEEGSKHVSIGHFRDGTWGWSIVNANGNVIDHNII